ncbi:MAG TPA: TonB-dependent receptor [Bacteroidales bacterium]|nr:TonB-dependent receptor [Bacteroidales bacterium]
MQTKHTLTILFAFFSLFTFAQTGVIKGRVFNASSNEPLPFTNIIIFGTNIGSVSDLDGNFLFTGIAPGYYKLAATSVGFENVITEELQVTNAKTTFLDIAMKEKPLQLAQIEVKSSPFKKVEESPVSLKTIGIAEIERSPGANRDISKVIQSLPGVASGLSYRNDLIVRGGGPSENRFLLDGIEIPNLNHFGTQGASGGSVGIINSDFLREVDLYTGAFPASRGNALSSVLDMRLIDGNPDKMVYRATLGASEMAVSASGPLSEKTTMLFSARRSYLQFLFSAIGLPFLPTFNDYTIKVKTRFDLKNELTILSIGSLDKSVLNTGIENPTEEQQYILSYLPSYDQWTYAIGAVYRHYRKNSYDTWVLSRNMLNNKSQKFENNDENANPVLKYESEEIENKLRYENTTRLNGYKILAGAGVEYVKYLNNTFQKVFIPTITDTLTSLNYDSFLDFFRYNAFGQVSKSYLENRLTLSAGVRMDGNSYSTEMSNLLKQFSPRVSASYGLTEKLFLNANAGRFFQLPSYTTLGYRDKTGKLVNKDNNIQYIRADHLVAGLEYRRSDNSRISLEGFMKFYDNYPYSVKDSVSLASKGADYGVYGDEAVVSTSKGRAFGAELYYRDRFMDKLSVILSYTFVRSEFDDKMGDLIPSAWDNRHILNISAAADLGKNWNVGAKWRFVGGAPYTPYDFSRSSLIEAWDARGQGYPDFNLYNTERLSNFHQLDLRIDKEYFFKKWSLNVYFDVQNAYNFKSINPDVLVLQRDANGIPLKDPNDPTRYSLKYLPSESGTVLPTLGIIIEL